MIYPLPEILPTVPCGTMAGAASLVEIERQAARKPSFSCAGFRPLRGGSPRTTR